MFRRKMTKPNMMKKTATQKAYKKINTKFRKYSDKGKC